MFPQRAPKWVFFVVAALVLVGLGSAIYSNGWSQGYFMGMLINGAKGAELAPYLAYRAGPGMMHGGFGFFGFIFRIGFLLLALAFFAKLFGFLHWRHMHGGQGPGSHEHWQHGPWGEQPQPPQQPQQPPQPPQAPQQPAPGGPTGGPNPPSEAGPQPVSWINV